MRENDPFDDISDRIKCYELTASTHCEPIYLMRNRSGERHDERTESATVTYIKFTGKYYALTCAHVANACEGGSLLIPTVWGKKKGYGYAFREGSANKLAGEFRTLELPSHGRRGLDIAIAPLSDDFVRLHMETKGKVALNLDGLEEFDWSGVRTCATWGFPNQGKSMDGEEVRANLLTTILELRSVPMSFDRDEFTLLSRLGEPARGVFFSGLSGSMIYCLHSNGGMTPVGIVYEGIPGDPSSKKMDGSFYDPLDFQIQAVVLSKAKFQDWLEMLDLT